MATPRWIGRALPRADVWTAVVGGTWVAGDTITLTINNRSLVLTVGSTVTTTAIATALKEMWNGDTATGNAVPSETGDNVPEFAEYTATVASSTATMTGNVKGRPGTISRTLSSAAGTVTLTNTIAATGPNHWDNALNWDTGSVPVDGDTVYLDNSDVDILYGLAQSAVQPAVMYVTMNYTGRIGLPAVSETGGYYEYRKTYLEIGPVILRIGDGVGNGSSRIKIDTGTDPCAITIVNTGNQDGALPAVLWKGTNAGNTLVMRQGSFGGAWISGSEVATLATFLHDNGVLRLGRGVTLSGALVVNDGDVQINSAIATSILTLAGLVQIDGSGAVAQLTNRGAYVIYNTTGTLGGNTILSGAGVLDFSQDPATKTITNPVDLYGTDCRLIDSDKVSTGGSNLIVDFNEGAQPSQCDFGRNVRLTRGTPS